MKNKLSVKREELAKIRKKFGDSISRFYFITAIDNKHDHPNFDNISLEFKGVVFYNTHDYTPEKQGSDTEMYKILTNEKLPAALCETVFGDTKIPVKFIKNPQASQKPEVIETSFDILG